nr:unnamed protein product [Callosobruchus analis]
MSQQHISASLSYNNWLQGNTIDTLLKSEIDSVKLHSGEMYCIADYFSILGHDSDSGNFMAISRLLSNYDATLKEPLLKPKALRFKTKLLFCLVQPLGAILSQKLKKTPFLTIILDTTQELSKIDQLSVVFPYILVTENDDNVPKEIKICESFLGFIAVTDCSTAGLKTSF